MGKTSAKKEDLDDDVAKMTSTIDQAVSKSAKLREQVRELETEMSNIAREQAEMDKARQDTHASYVKSTADLKMGLSGVRKALDVLNEYYSSGSSAALVQDDSEDSNFNSFMQQPTPPETFSK